jgi:prolipoprotein diacylglyceryl transferase
MADVAVWGVPGGLIGARVYSLATSWGADTQGHWYRAFEIWRGGLGIWGGVLGGIALGAVGARRHHVPIPTGLDCVAPAFAIGQAIGRWGNYFNQELFGRPTRLPWGLEISTKNRPAGYSQYSTFQPTFLYECIWDLITLFLVIWVERRFRIRRGYLITVYAAIYTLGRFWTEYLRIDEAHRYLGLRLNDWTSIIVFVGSTAVLLIWGRAKEGEDRAGTPMRDIYDPGGDGTEVPEEAGRIPT